MSMSAFHVVAVLCIGFPLVVAGSARECNTTVEGYTWRYDVEVDEVIPGSPSVKACIDECLEDAACEGYTWTDSGIIPTCYKFKHSLGMVEIKCDSCSSGVVPLQFDGACVVENDDFLDHKTAHSVQECFQLCSETDGCQAYTWWDDTTPFINTCFLYGDCQEQLPCEGCASGNINCISYLPDQCEDYMVLDEPDRSVSNGGCGNNGGDECYCDVEGISSTSPDWQGPGYYRMLSPAGTQLPESTPGFGHCGTNGVIWLRGEHPQDVGLEKNMAVCFDFGSSAGDCYRTAEITVTNCDGYYVYMLPATPTCNYRYCASNKNIIF